jgi:hypothetical protein
MIPGSNGETRHACDDVDILKTESADTVLWRGTFSSLEAATARIKQLLVSEPGEYFTHSQSTGNKLFFKLNGHNGHNGTR